VLAYTLKRQVKLDEVAAPTAESLISCASTAQLFHTAGDQYCTL
jgi:hypothetical protein